MRTDHNIAALALSSQRASGLERQPAPGLPEPSAAQENAAWQPAPGLVELPAAYEQAWPAQNAAPDMPMLALPEPGSPRMQRALVAGPARAARWRVMLDSPHAASLRRPLLDQDFAAIRSHIQHHQSILAAQLPMQGAARMRNATDVVEQCRATIKNASARLHSIATLVIDSSWPLAPKLELLSEVRDALQKNGVLLRTFKCFGDNYLHIALRSPTTGHDLAKLLEFFILQGVDVNQCDAGGAPVSHLLQNHAEAEPALFALLMSGARPNDRDAIGHTLMHKLVSHPLNVELLEACVVGGGLLQAVTRRGESLLHMLLAQKDDPRATKYLMDNGVSPYAHDHMGLTAFDYAAYKERSVSLPWLGQPPPLDPMEFW